MNVSLQFRVVRYAYLWKALLNFLTSEDLSWKFFLIDNLECSENDVTNHRQIVYNLTSQGRLKNWYLEGGGIWFILLSFSCEKVLNTIVCYRKYCRLEGAIAPGPLGPTPVLNRVFRLTNSLRICYHGAIFPWPNSKQILEENIVKRVL